MQVQRFFSGYFTVNDKLYCETDARAAKAAQMITKEQNYQQLKQQQQQHQHQQHQQQVRAKVLTLAWDFILEVQYTVRV